MTIINKLFALASTLAVSAYAMVTLGDQEMRMVNAQDGITVSGKPDVHVDGFSYVEPEEMPGITPSGDVIAMTVPQATQPLLLAPALSVSVEALNVGNSKTSLSRPWTWAH